MKRISSRDNAIVKHVHALASSARERRKSAQTLLDGPHLLEVALAHAYPLASVIVSDSGAEQPEIAALLARCAGVPCILLPDSLFAFVSPVDSPSGILAVIAPPEAGPGRVITDSCIVLDAVQDPGNLGSILRSAAAVGVREMLLTPGCAQAWAPRVLRAAMGAHFTLSIREGADVASLLAAYPGAILATALHDSTDLYRLDLRGPVAWLFGSEGQGLSPAIAALASGRVRIPMPGGMESLNVGVAAGVCLFEQLRQVSGQA